MTATIEELPTQAIPVDPSSLRPAVREALWGYLFIGPWLIGLAAVHRRPDDRLAR